MIIWICGIISLILLCVAALITRYKITLADVILSAIAGVAAGLIILFCGHLVIFNLSTIDDYTFIEDSSYKILEAHTLTTEEGYVQYNIVYETKEGSVTKIIEAANAHINYVNAEADPTIQLGTLKHSSDTINWLFSIEYPISILNVPVKE